MDLRQLTSSALEDALGMWRYRWPALAVAWVLALAGWTWVLLLPNQYDSEARVFVNAETMLKPLLRDLTVPADTLSEVAVMTQVLLSQPQLRTVAIETGLERRAQTPEDLQLLVQGLQQKILINKLPRQDIYTIEYRDSDPRMARDVVQVLLTSFMENSLSNKRTDSTQAQSFLQEQIKLYERRLEEAEARLADFKKSNVGLMPGEGRDYFSRLQTAEGELQLAQAEVRALQQRRGELLRQVEGEEPVLGLASMGAGAQGTSVDGPIAELERQVSELLVQYTEKHPDVLRIRQTLDDLYKIRDEERARRAASPAASNPLDQNPVYQQMRVSLSATEAELASANSRVAEKAGQVNYLRRMMDTIPEVEAELNRLNRDYDIVKKQYDALVERLEMSRLSEDLQTDSEQVTFEVIEPPRIPLLPSAPNRPLLYAAVMVFALGGGVALAFLLNQHNPVFYSGHRLREATGLPVFGAVSSTAPPQVRGSSIAFGVGTSVLVLAFAVLLVIGAGGIVLTGA